MSVSLDASADVRAGVALVTARVSNPGPVARRVRLVNRLDGPVLPPRRRGAPADGWSAEGFDGVVPAEETLAVGYACPVGEGASAGRPLKLADVSAPRGTTAPPVERARRDLPPSAPPRDAVPLPDGPQTGRADPDEAGREADDAAADRGAAGSPAPGDATDPTAERDDRASRGDREGGDDPAGSPAAPAGDGADGGDGAAAGRSSDATAVDAYLDTVERRVARGEQLTDASVAEATAALAGSDLDGTPVAELPDALAADAAALEALAERAERLAERARATDVPVDALRRLA
ncbi:DUF7857 domain-containing protein [Candidatus Halobonum tyrrellensis]|uniref:DUF8080 domain-containing protein n=1 Tax=Candidatus Halobonum tyrrellensis G22 TaxID=1324957 RepID=V4HBX9_9EURY|nr:hypothetical protein [Candidatus Halobonum tyrrellensis]ESP88210.1 hypothetical protein K933_10100 [Candidatus Halobonum tyrrellensis G22]